MVHKKDADAYFRKKIAELLDDIYSPSPIRGLASRSEQLTGALIYAKDMGDIDLCYYRIFTDTLASLADDISYTKR